MALADAEAIDILKRSKPEPHPDSAPPAATAALIDALDAKEFRIREAATKALRLLGVMARPAVREALAGTPSAEARPRLEAVLAVPLPAPEPATGETLRTIRAIAALEAIASPEAKKVLRTLASGAEGERVTDEALDALDRLGAK